MQAFDDETSRIVGDTLLWCIKDLARDKGEIRQTFDDNKDLFGRLTEADKKRLRDAWAVAMERLSNG